MARRSRRSEDAAERLYASRRTDTRDVEPFSMWAFVLALAPVLVIFIPVVNLAALVLPLVAIPLGIVGLVRALKRPEWYRGAGFAIAALVIAALTFIGAVIAVFFIAAAITSF